jgi:glutamine amidotransferase
MTVRAVIVAAGGANYGSLREACRRTGVAAEVSNEPARISAATHVILPGVGAAAQAMRTLRECGLDRVLAALTQPLLGICLGMQLLFEQSEETPHAGHSDRHHPHPNSPGPRAQPSGVHRRADQWSASAHLHPLEGEGFRARDRNGFDMGANPSLADRNTVACLGLLAGGVRRLPAAPRWPHMGWNTLRTRAPAHPLLDGIGANDWFYFVHGYAAPVGAQAIASADHGSAFAAVVAQRNIHGVQFHPEKSAASGRRLLGNFFGLR